MGIDKGSNRQFQAAIRIAVDTQGALLLLNGGAALALIATTSRSDARHSYALSIACFGTAALAAVIGLVLSYFSQLSYAGAVREAENDDLVKAGAMRERYEIFSRLAISFVMLSIGVCLFSLWTAYGVASQ